MRAERSHAIVSGKTSLSSFSEPLAKREKTSGSFQTFDGHITDCLTTLSYIVEKEKRAIDAFCTRLSINRGELLRSLFLSTVLHDIGKLTLEFQQRIRAGSHSGAWPHAFFSLPLLNWIFKEHYKEAFLEPSLLLEICTVLGHHTQLHTNMYRTVTKDVRYLKLDIAEFLGRIDGIRATVKFGSEFSIQNIEVEPGDVPSEIGLNEISSLERQIKDFIQELMLYVSEYPEKERAKALYTFCQSMLKASDHMASRSFDEFAKSQSSSQVFGPVLKDPSRFFKDLTVREDRCVPPGMPLYNYQSDLYNQAPMFVLVRAPCGRGKTNAAALWAKACHEKYGCTRMIVAMPTQITSNAMRSKLAEFSSKEEVGIFHGRSFFLLREERKKLARHAYDESDDLNPEDLEEVKTENYQGRVYHKPITISTTDHLVYSLVHGYSQADYALGNIQRAALIFDEVHYYERQSLECLMNVFRILRRMKIPHLIMSGTLPSFFVDKVNEENSYITFNDVEGSNLAPFTFRRRYGECLIVESFVSEQVLDEIVRNYENKLRQFIILNTVTRAKRFYDAVKKRLGPSANVVLHHSQFAFDDRSKKEELVLTNRETRPFILIATQIIEISLDISCDVMYTEIAPADALGQRGGRLHRGGKSHRTDSTEHTMNIFEVDNHLPYVQELLDKTKAALFDGPASYLRIAEVCDEVYNSVRLHEHVPFGKLFSESTLFGRPYWDISSEDEDGRPGFQFREENEYPTISVIPEGLYRNEEKNLTAENQVQVPLWKVIKHQDDTTMFYPATRLSGSRETIFWICRVPYNGEVGFVEDHVPEAETFGSNIF